MNRIANDILMHYGMPKRSGRYPWGSGDNPYQRSGDFISRINELKKQGMKDADIAKDLGMSTTDMRTYISIAKNERRNLDVATAKGLKDKGYSLNEIGRQMGINESTVRSLLDPRSEELMNQARNTADFLKARLAEKGMLEVGKGVERELGISAEKMREALYILEGEGYEVYGRGIPQVTNPGQQTNIKVLCPPGTPYKDVYDNIDQIGSVKEYVSHDGGDTFDTFIYPKSMDSDRIKICYAEEGGSEKDGVVEIRRGVDDLDLGESHYAQVRILVDDTKYVKGMAIYSDDMPDGADIVFYTNKKQGTSKEDVLKNIENDPDNPFGSLIKAGGQSYYIDENGQRQLSLINKRAEEGDWGDWSKGLPSQFLAKQNVELMKKQLNLDVADKQAEFDDIMALNNPTVKKALLETFSEDCDSAAVHLKAAALPRQGYQVILPIPSMKDDEVYAPNYNNGEQVALIRFPHGGTFEIPIVTVNNKQKDVMNALGNTPADAVGINAKVAARLSGADFDGDTVMVIPVNDKVKITHSPPLKELEGFDTKMAYPKRPGSKVMKQSQEQMEMGKVSNLITDMTLKGASQDEIARAVKHSMVVIDSVKHGLDYKKSEADNGIASLKKKYQGHQNENDNYSEGASTLLSRAKSQKSVTKRQGSPKTDEITGEKIWKDVDEPTYVTKTGKVKEKNQRSTQMAETRDARTLSSGTPQEEVYASYANKMKAMANTARKEILSTGKIEYSKAAKDTYQKEYDSLMAKLNIAEKNRPKEKQAQIMANAVMKAKKQDNPDMTSEEIRKASQQALTAARNSVGAKRETIKVTDREWEAIQAGAVSENKLKAIINRTDIDDLRQRATPRSTTKLSAAKINKIKVMQISGYSTAEIAKAVGVSTSTVSGYIRGKE